MAEQLIADKYEVLETIGQGGIGVVYKARHILMKRIVAIKMLHESLVANELTRKRFEQEAQAISMLNHPNIMTVYDFGVTEDQKPYLVVEFLEGQNLESLLEEIGAMPLSRALPIFTDAASAMAHAHEKGVIHRDIKPSNFMLIELEKGQEMVKIVDFGIAKLIQDEQQDKVGLTTTGEIFGSPLYMSPEQCKGFKLDARSDIYSFGCVMYRTLTGEPPFPASNVPECLYKHVHEMPECFTNVKPDMEFPEGLEEIVFKAMAKEPEDRFQTMSEIKQALEPYKLSSIMPAAAGSSVNNTQMKTNMLPKIENANTTQSTVEKGTKENEQASSELGEYKAPFNFLVNPSLKMKLAGSAIVIAVVVVVFMFFGNMQPSVADINKYMTSGDKSFSAGDFNASQIAYEQAFQMAKKVGEETLENQAFEKHLKSLLELGKYTDLTNESLQEQKAPLAIDLLKSCLAEIRAKYGDKSLAEADCLYALASLYEKSGDYDQAEKYFSQSLQIKSAASGVATSKPAGTEKEPASAQTVATKEIEEHIASVKKQKANVKARKPVRKAVTRVPAKKETRKEASTKSDKDADGDKRGFFGSIGHGVKKVFGVFGHHKKEK